MIDNTGSAYQSYLTADATTTSTAAVNVTGLSFPVGGNEAWTFEFNLRIGSSSTAGMKVALTFPSGATLLATAIGATSGVTAQSTDLMSASGTLGLAFNTFNGQTGVLRITGCITTGSTPGIVQLQQAKVTSGTSTVAALSFLRAQRTSKL